MSYLASLARPAGVAIRAAAEPAPAPRVETFGEVHEEVAVAPREVASEATEARVDRSGDRGPSVVDSIEVRVASPVGALEPTSRAGASQHTLPRVAAPVTQSAPILAQPHATPTAAEARTPPVDTTSPREASPPPARRVGEPLPVARAGTTPLVPEPFAPRAPAVRHAERGLGRGEPAHERTQPSPRAPTMLPAGSKERLHKPTVPAEPAPTSRPEVNVHIGAISLTVKAPAAATPAARPAAPPVAQPLPVAAPRRAREGLGFSTSRHYLRWS
jgi:hypothetical protein